MVAFVRVVMWVTAGGCAYASDTCATNSCNDGDEIATLQVKLQDIVRHRQTKETSLSLQELPSPVFVGCHVDDAAHDLDRVPEGQLSPLDLPEYGYNLTTCSAACSNYNYFALQNSGWCVCGNAYATDVQYIRVDTDECGDPCKDDDTTVFEDLNRNTPNERFCGGPLRNAVYRQPLPSCPSYENGTMLHWDWVSKAGKCDTYRLSPGNHRFCGGFNDPANESCVDGSANESCADDVCPQCGSCVDRSSNESTLAFKPTDFGKWAQPPKCQSHEDGTMRYLDWDGGYGGCEQYSSSHALNHEWCNSHYSPDGAYAVHVCPQCGTCVGSPGGSAVGSPAPSSMPEGWNLIKENWNCNDETERHTEVMTLDGCAAVCLAGNFHVAGLWYDTVGCRCFDNCNGGQDTASIHPNMVIQQAQAVSAFVGCFVDDEVRGLVPPLDLPEYGYDRATCSAACSMYTFFALKRNGWCVCGNEYATDVVFQADPGHCLNAVYRQPLPSCLSYDNGTMRHLDWVHDGAKCDTFILSPGNHDFCGWTHSDCAGEGSEKFCASDVCPQCGSCVDRSANWKQEMEFKPTDFGKWSQPPLCQSHDNGMMRHLDWTWNYYGTMLVCDDYADDQEWCNYDFDPIDGSYAVHVCPQCGTCFSATTADGCENGKHIEIPTVVHTDPADTASVRCCSEDEDDTSCDSHGCHSEVTWDEAQKLCADAGKRICTDAEMKSKVCCGTGCGFNRQAVWVRSAWQVE